MSLSSLLTNVGTLQRMATTRDSSGGIVKNPANLDDFTGIPCLIQPKSAKERYILAQRNVYASHNIYFDQDIGARRDDLFISSDGRKFVVVYFYNMAGQDFAWKLEAKEQAQ